MDTKLLKQKILDLAIHGKLVPQNPNDEPASKLLEKIREEKQKLIAEKKIKADKNDSYIFVGDDNRHYEKFADGTVKDIENSIPFDLPNNWCWIRLQEIADIARGGSPRPIEDYLTNDESGINWIKIGDTKPGSKYIVSAKEKIKAEGKNHSRYVQAGDFLLTNSMSFGRPYILKIDGCIHDGWLVFANIKNCLLQDYLYHALSSKYIYDSFSLVAAGSTVKNLKSDTVKQVLFPLPPIDEQKRILEEIERIIEIIEKLDDDKMELSQAIIQTKSKILDLAIHGKLVPQDSFDEPASVLLEKLRAEKEAKIKAGELKRDKNDSYIYKNTTDNCYYEKFQDGAEELIEVPYDLPESWSWSRLGSICDYGKCKNASVDALNDKTWVLDLEDIEKDTGRILRFETHETRNSLSTKHVFKKGDILYSKLRPYLNKVVIAPKDGVCTSEILPLDFNGILINEYAQCLLMSSYFLTTVNLVTYGVKMPRLGTDDAKKMLLPVPPLNEQLKIICSVKKLQKSLDEIALNLV